MSGCRLSLLIVARNEERRIAACIESANFADEIVVQLDRSEDATGDIAERLGARIVTGAWPDEGARRTAGIQACKGDWILELDADERVSPELASEIGTKIACDAADYYVIPFRNYFGGRWVRFGWGAYNGVNAKGCLFRRGVKTWHSGLVHPPIEMDGMRGEMTGHIDHFVDDSLNTMYDRLNRYSALAARDALTRGTVPHPLSTTRRFFSRFFRSYGRNGGYREGWRGAALAVFSALYPVLTHLKIRELEEGQKDEH